MSQQQPEQQSESNNKSNLRYQDLSNKKPVCIIAVPKCHENLYKHIEDNHNWLSQTIRHGSSKYRNGKKINTDEDRQKFEKLIQDLRTEKSELFIDKEYHPKPLNQSIAHYIDDFLRSKGIHTHYAFTNFYRITIFPSHIKDIDAYLSSTDFSKGENDVREEYLIVPLLIRLKRGKSYSQSKMVVGLDETTGEVIVKDVNPKHFYIERPEPIDEEKEEENRIKMEFLTS